jgi:metal-responsive CopG/Arc/MetJ family transcriptional regulator
MAKVMVSLPDDLLADLDAEAARRGLTRSGLLRDLAERSLRRRGEDRAARASAILAGASAHGGKVAELVKRHRPPV